MNISLFKFDIKRNYILFLVITGVLLLYMNIITGMYDPNGMEVMQELASMKMGGGDLMKIMGFDFGENLQPTLVKYLSQYFYGFLIFMFPMIYVISISNRLIAKSVDNGSIAFILSTPNTRMKIWLTHAIFLVVSTFLLIAIVTLFGIIFASKMFPGLLDVSTFITLNWGAFMVMFTISGICFFFSSLFNESSKAIGFSTALPIIFLLMQMISNAGEKLSFLKNFTFFTLFNSEAIVNKESVGLEMTVLALIGLACFAGGSIIFKKKDLSV